MLLLEASGYYPPTSPQSSSPFSCSVSRCHQPPYNLPSLLSTCDFGFRPSSSPPLTLLGGAEPRLDSECLDSLVSRVEISPVTCTDSIWLPRTRFDAVISLDFGVFAMLYGLCFVIEATCFGRLTVQARSERLPTKTITTTESNHVKAEPSPH